MRLPLVLIGAALAATAAAQPGTLDPTFGTRGVVLPAQAGSLLGVAAAPGGGVVAVGQTPQQTGLVLLLRADGLLDPAAGGAVGVPAGPAGWTTAMRSAAVDSHGRVVAVGSDLHPMNSGDRPVIVRLAGGGLDAQFGAGGAARPLPVGYRVRRILPLEDGLLLVTGDAGLGTRPACFAAQLTASGALDGSFGTAGVATARAPDGQSVQSCGGAARLPDGRIVLAGDALEPGVAFRAFLALLSADGVPDPSLGPDGVATVPLCPGLSCLPYVKGVAADTSGRFVLAGYRHLNTGRNEGFAARVGPDGLLDATFGTQGVRRVQVGAASEVWDLLVQPDGRIVVVGSTSNASFTNFDAFVARLLPDGGALDPGFGSAGVARVHVGPEDAGYALAQAADGSLLVVGWASESAFVARLRGGGGVAGEAGPSAPGLALSVAPQPLRDVGRLTLRLPLAQAVRVSLLDALGRRVALVHDGPLGAGVHALPLPAHALAPGLYIVRADGSSGSVGLRVVVARP